MERDSISFVRISMASRHGNAICGLEAPDKCGADVIKPRTDEDDTYWLRLNLEAKKGDAVIVGPDRALYCRERE
ncbi:uncharacterized protein H6S33_006369 [Morchella sextelata]|uniref:uncharacterized protein n=1 Tax=Morchella sextelata TaxID=1174677 RepID=UPI001D03F70C|nr:uncharacterized protein H6S33_006369 [Morchella sextelata]KAH0604701.1 hypothetical protein H6S33_006369 [Morchella sextelata]